MLLYRIDKEASLMVGPQRMELAMQADRTTGRSSIFSSGLKNRQDDW